MEEKAAETPTIDDEPYSDPEEYPHQNQSSKRRSYWDDRFIKEVSYEWLLDYEELKLTLLPRINKTDKILIVGCGNSLLGPKLVEEGYIDVVSSDYSKNVINKMRQSYPDLQWVISNVKDLKQFPDAHFDVVLDKATMDLLVTDEGCVNQPNKRTIADTNAMCTAVQRVLKSRGKYIQFTCQPVNYRRNYLFECHGTTPHDWKEVECVSVPAPRTLTYCFVIQKNN